MILSTERRAPFLLLSPKPFRSVFMDCTLTPPHGKCCLCQLKVSHGLMNLFGMRTLSLIVLCSQTFDLTAKCSDSDREPPKRDPLADISSYSWFVLSCSFNVFSYIYIFRNLYIKVIVIISYVSIQICEFNLHKIGISQNICE